MSNVRFSDLPQAQGLIGNELVMITQNGFSRRTTADQFATIVAPPVGNSLILGLPDVPDLVDVSVALNVGALDPSTSPHMEFGPGQIQTKLDFDTVMPISINELGGTVRLGNQTSADGSEVEIYMDTFTKAFFSSGGPGFGLAVAGDPSVPDVMTGGIDFVDRDLNDSYAFLGFDGTANIPLQLANRAFGGHLELIGTNGAGANRVMLSMDPDAAISIRHPATDATVAVTADPSVGGLQVDNQFTGTGLERVMTFPSDVAPGALPTGLQGDMIFINIAPGTYATTPNISYDSVNTRLNLQNGITLYMEEVAAAQADVPTYGQFWVRNDAPNVPMFTDDLGNDFVLNGGITPGSAEGEMVYWDNTGLAYEPSASLRWLEATLELQISDAGFIARDAAAVLEIRNGAGDPRMQFTETDGGVVIVEQNALRISGDGAAGGGRLALFSTAGGRAELSCNGLGLLQFGSDGPLDGAVFNYPMGISGGDGTNTIGNVSLFTYALSGGSGMYGRNVNDFRYPILNYDQVSYRFNSPTAAGDPGATFFRVNNVSFAASTEMYFADEDLANNPDAAFFFDSLHVGDLIHAVQGSDPTRWIMCTVVSVTDNTGFYTIVYTVDDSNGTVFINGRDVQFFVEHLSFAGGGATVPGGVDTNVQFNSAGAFGGDAGFTYSTLFDQLSLTSTFPGAPALILQTNGPSPEGIEFRSTQTNPQFLAFVPDSGVAGFEFLGSWSGADSTHFVRLKTTANAFLQTWLADRVEILGGNLTVTDNAGSPQVRVQNGNTLSISEIAAAHGDISGTGQFWVRNDAPNTPMFTDDLGNDFVLNAANPTGPQYDEQAFDSTVNNSIVLVNSDLTLSNVPTGRYQISMMILARDVAVSNCGIRIDLSTTGVGSQSTMKGSLKLFTGAGAPTTDLMGLAIDTFQFPSLNSGSSTTRIQFQGYIDVTSGTNSITVQFAQNTAQVGDLDLESGSFISLLPLE